jgi:tetratricopeptide (TPR) repeat protein
MSMHAQTSSRPANPKFTDNASIAQHFRRPIILLSLISVMTFIVYSIGLSFGFVSLDNSQIVDNPLVRSWHNLPQVYLGALWGKWPVNQTCYRPLFTTWSLFNYSLFRLEPWGWHLTTILLHIAVVWAVYLLACKLRLPIWTAFLSCAIFALHPLHIEVISCVSAASEAMATVFYLLALVSFIQAREAEGLRRVRWRILSFLTLTCALLTNEMAITFCLIVALYVLFLSATAGNTGDRVRESAWAAFPYAIVTVFYLVLRKYALDALVMLPPAHHSSSEVLLTIPYVLAFYFRLFLCPVGLTGLYYTPYIRPQDLGKVLGSLLLLAALIRLLWSWHKKTGDRQVVFLSFWGLLALAPALYLPRFADSDFVHDRFAYLPSVGFVLLAAKALSFFSGTAKVRASSVRLATAALLIAFTVGAEQQIYWANEHAFFQRARDLYPKSELAAAGQNRLLAGRDGDLYEIASLQQSIRTQPSPRAYLLLAEAYLNVGNDAAARQVLSEDAIVGARTITVFDAAELVGVYRRLGDYDRALRICDSLLRADPFLVPALDNCGAANFLSGNLAQAERLLIRAVETTPDDAAPVYWLGRVDLQAGRLQDAQAELRKATELNAQVADYHYWLARCMETAGNLRQAEQEYQRASTLKRPDAKAFP